MNFIIIGGVFIFIIALILYFRFRDNPKNNLRRAMKHHKLGKEHHNGGNKEEADLHYEMAKVYREKALKQEEDV